MSLPYIPTECLQKTFNYLYDDIKSLYSCTLVSRDWCKSSVHLLWKQTFHLDEARKNIKLVPAYFPFLTDEARMAIGIDLPRPKTAPLFDYPSFLRQLNYTIMYESISAWWDHELKLQAERLVFLEEDQRYAVATGSSPSLPLDPSDATIRKVLIAQELAKLFMQRCGSFDCLHLETTLLRDQIANKWQQIPQEYLHFPSFIGAKDCLSNLAAFECGGDWAKDRVFSSLSHICKDLKLMTADGIDFGNSAAVELANLIQIQRRLQIFIISRCNNAAPVVTALGTQSETLKHLQFSYCDFKDGDSLSALANCSGLDTLRFNHCGTLSADVIAPLKCARLPYLNNLDFTYTFAPTRSFVEILSCSTPSLREVCLGGHSEHTAEIIDGIAKYCPQIMLFEVTIKRDGIYALPNLFRSCQKLEVVKFYGDLSSWEGFWDASDVIAPIGGLVPVGMHDLVIVTNWAISAEALKSFLQRCRATLTCIAMHCQEYADTLQYKDAIYDYTEQKNLGKDQVQYRVVDRLLEYSYGY